MSPCLKSKNWTNVGCKLWFFERVVRKTDKAAISALFLSQIPRVSRGLHTHTHTHARTQTNKHKRTKHTHTKTHTHIKTHTDKYTHKNIHTHTQKNTDTKTHTHTGIWQLDRRSGLFFQIAHNRLVTGRSPAAKGETNIFFVTCFKA